MKTSKKLLIILAGAFMSLFIISLFVLRGDMEEVVHRYQLETGFRPVKVGPFDKLEFGPEWTVTINRGLDNTVSVMQDNGGIPSVKNIDGTLIFTKNPDSLNADGRARARIFLTKLESIKAAKGTEIELIAVETDSLSVVLENSQSFSGLNNTIKHLSFKTTGEVALEFSQTE